MSNVILKTAYLTLKDSSGNVYEPDCLFPKDGKSVYEYALAGGYKGTEEEFIASLTSNSIDYHPVGSIYITGLDINPASLFGGDWEQLSDVFLLSASDIESTSKTYIVDGEVYGEAEHTISIEEFVQHSHVMYVTSGNTNGGYRALETWHKSRSGKWNTTYVGGKDGKTMPHNNMPPYIVKNIWRRVS